MTLRRILIGLGAVAGAFVLTLVASSFITDGVLGLLDSSGEGASYFLIFFFVAGDAVIPIFPGETTLNTASVLASEGELDLVTVMAAGALGAIVGDTALYWIARSDIGGLSERADKLRSDERVEKAFEILGKRAPLLLVFGRYVPGVRFVVNFTMGLTRMPYGSFLFWSTIGGTTWSVYTCLLAYSVGVAIDDYPLGSIIISGAITTALIGVIFWLDVRRRRAAQPDDATVD
jgi:membrane protein DedA with SNARE-associated domain